MKKILFFISVFLNVLFGVFADSNAVSNIQIKEMKDGLVPKEFTVTFSPPTKSVSRRYYYYILFEDNDTYLKNGKIGDGYFKDTGGYYTSRLGWYKHEEYRTINVNLSYSDVTDTSKNLYGKGVSVSRATATKDEGGNPLPDVLISHGYVSGSGFTVKMNSNYENPLKLIVFTYYPYTGNNQSTGANVYESSITFKQNNRIPEILENSIVVKKMDGSKIEPNIENGYYYTTEEIRVEAEFSDKIIKCKYSNGLESHTKTMTTPSERIGFTTQDLPGGLQTIYFAGCNDFFNYSENKEIQVYRYKGLTVSITEKEDENGNVVLTAKANNLKFPESYPYSDQYFPSSFDYYWQIKNGNIFVEIDEKTDTLTLDKDGTYAIKVVAKNYAGDIVESLEKTISVKKSGPEVTELNLLYYSNLVLVDWIQEDASAIAGSMYYSLDGVTYHVRNLALEEIKNRKAVLDVAMVDRKKENILSIYLTLFDERGRETKNKIIKEISIPKTIEISNYKSAESGSFISNTLFIENLENYSKVRIEERISDNKNDIKNKSFKLIKTLNSADFVNKQFREDVERENGHKYIQYKLTAISTTNNQDFEESSILSEIFEIANSSGKMDMKCVGKNNEELNLNETEIDSGNFLTFYYSGTDQDLDEWNVKIFSVNYLSNTKELLSKSEIKIENSKSKAGYFTLYPVIGNNNIVAEWEEITSDGRKEKGIGCTFSFSVKQEELGKFKIHFSSNDGILISTGKIQTNPGKKIKFTSSVPVNWNFGDGTESVIASKETEHIYYQSENQEKDSFEYTLTITSTENEADFDMIIVTCHDTQQGELLTNEIWRGPHTVYGKVVVPAGKRLEIQQTDKRDTKILFVNSDADNNPASIYVKGNFSSKGLKSENDSMILFKKEYGRTVGCSILIDSIEGKNEIENSIFMGLEQGLSVNNNCTAVITNCIFQECEIGIHNLGNLNLKEIKYENNSEYDLKEEKSALTIIE